MLERRIASKGRTQKRRKSKRRGKKGRKLSEN
jgi:hypothetical protein